MTDPRLDNAMKLRRAGRLNEAAQIYAGILQSEPRHFEALHGLGILHYQAGQMAEAERLIGQAVAENPASPDANYNRACLLMRLGRSEEALSCFDRALALKPNYVEALVNRAALLSSLKRYEDALETLERVLALKPDLAQAWANRAAAFLALGRHTEAVESYDRALALKPSAELWKNRGAALILLGDPARALDSFEAAAKLAPQDSELIRDRGNALTYLGRREEAASAFETYLASRPNDAEVWHNRAALLQQSDRLAALACLDRAVALAPGNLLYRESRGNLLFMLDRFEEAAADFDVLMRQPSPPAWVRGYITTCRLHCGDWSTLREDLAAIHDSLARGQAPLDPLGLAAIDSSLADQLECARQWSAQHHPPQMPLSVPGDSYGHDKIRIAYLSADFRGHATAVLMAGVFEHHDRQRFETTAISYSFDDGNPIRERLKAAFDRFIEVRDKSDADVARMMREMEIDIAVDLKGYTGEGRLGILAYRPAPVQVHYLGYPGTLGADYIDYLIADPIVVPPEHQPCYSEKIAYLPDTYQCNDRVRAEASMPTRAEAGLLDDAFVFCCFNNNHKIMPGIFDVWMRLLRAVPGSMLWLYRPNDALVANFGREAEARGVAKERLIFAPRVDQLAHIARQRLADLFLDTLPYNAHTTASDALWAGLPLVTCLGSTFAGRVAASVLHAAGMDELVTHSLEEYEALALKLAREPGALAAAKRKLAEARATAPLFDVARITRNLEAAYIAMWERNRRGDPPETFAVGEGGPERAAAAPPQIAAKAQGRGLIAEGRFGDALAAYDRALAVSPADPDALRMRADLLFQLSRFAEAVAAYDHALAVSPRDADAWNQRGIALAELKRREEAIDSFGRALALDPLNADAQNNRANALFELKRFEEAARDYEWALSLNPELPYAEGYLVQCRLRACDWSSYSSSAAHIANGIEAGKRISDPLGHLVISRSPARERQCARLWNADMFPPAPKPLWKTERYSHEKIRVAYLSGDFRPHPVAFLIAGVFEQHDKSRIETVGVSFAQTGESEIRTRIESAFDRLIDGRKRSDAEIARMLREMEVDIAVDLMGYTEGCRTGILAHRVAPVQVNYLGFPGTMGAPYIDYIFADRIVIPESERPHYSETVVYLPDAYQANDSRRRASDRIPSRAEEGLPETGFVFACFNNNFKIAPDVFDVWMRLLRAIPGSVLWLLKDNEAAAANLRREASARGTDPARLAFATRVSPADHLARHALADLFLDTLPYTAHTTASDALWMGLPLITCTGTTFAGRVATSLLHAAGVPELATASLGGYEALALKLASDRAALDAVKRKLAANRKTCALFDTARITRNLESAYTIMRERAQRGESPMSFVAGQALVRA